MAEIYLDEWIAYYCPYTTKPCPYIVKECDTCDAEQAERDRIKEIEKDGRT